MADRKKTQAQKDRKKKYCLVTAPVAPLVDIVEGEKELMEMLAARAHEMGVPTSSIVSSGLFKVFEKEVELLTKETEIGLKA